RFVHQHEAVAIERELVTDRPHVVNGHLVLVDRPVALRAVAGMERRLLAAHDILHGGAYVAGGGSSHVILSGRTLARLRPPETRRAGGASRQGSPPARRVGELPANPARSRAGRCDRLRPTAAASGGRSPSGHPAEPGRLRRCPRAKRMPRGTRGRAAPAIRERGSPASTVRYKRDRSRTSSADRSAKPC